MKVLGGETPPLIKKYQEAIKGVAQLDFVDAMVIGMRSLGEVKKNDGYNVQLGIFPYSFPTFLRTNSAGNTCNFLSLTGISRLAVYPRFSRFKKSSFTFRPPPYPPSVKSELTTL